VREGDSVLDVVPANTLDHVVLFSSDGVAYTLPVDQIPASSGYGEPISKFVRLGDGAGIVKTITTDARFTPGDEKSRRQPTPSPYLLIVTARGQVMQISFSLFRAASTKAGRRYCRLRSGDRVVFVELLRDAKTMFVATSHARVLHFKIDEVPVLGAAGKGVRGIKLEDKDEVLGAMQLSRPSDCLHIVNTSGKTLSFGQQKYSVTSRGGKGVKTSMRTGFTEVMRPQIELVDWSTMEGE
jgi:DNA gyrase subunit A